MKSAMNYMLCWNPHSAEVALVKHPDVTGASDRYRCTTLADWVTWRKLSRAERTQVIVCEALHLIIRDGCDPAAVHRALWPLEEYRSALASDVAAPKGLRDRRRAGQAVLFAPWQLRGKESA